MNYMMKHHSIIYECTQHRISGTNLYYIFQKKCITSFTDVLDHDYLLVNHLLLIFNYIVFNSKVNNIPSFQRLKYIISQTKYIEETIGVNDINKERKKLNKWKLIYHLFNS